MSIKQIDNAGIDDHKGVQKTINIGANKLMLEVLQATQYSTPIPSTVRELTTNAWDSQREKEIAIEILTGEKSVADYYISRDGEQYKDSNFDHSYYDLNFLDRERNTVELIYTKRNDVGYCDSLEVVDFGVGIGGKRLEGVLSLGFSTKRNTTEGFGAFGLGAKVALSTNVPFYTIETIHNGRKFRCNCYMYKTLSVIPKFNIEKGIENPSITFASGDVFYYEETTEKNKTVISFGIKKHNRVAFKEAVKEQLLYIDNVFFTEVDEESDPVTSSRRSTKAQIAYASDSVILSDYTSFSKPHIVIVKRPGDTSGINYGFVDFKELEMEQLHGSIGFKCPVRQSYRDDDGIEHVIHEGVSVTPSREKVIWNEHTKDYIHSVINEATEEASKMLEKELGESSSIFNWSKRCRDIFSRSGDQSVLGRMSNIVDKEKLSPVFPGSKRIRFGGAKTVFKGILIEKVSVDYKGKANRVEVDSWDQIPNTNHIFIKDMNYSPLKDIYLCEKMRIGTFLTVQYEGLAEADEIEIMKKSPEKGQKLIDSYNEHSLEVWDLIKKDPNVKLYSSIEVPKDVEEEIETKLKVNSIDKLSPSERRKLEQKEVAYTGRIEYYDREVVLDKVEPKKSQLFYPEGQVFYSSSSEKDVFVSACKWLTRISPRINHSSSSTMFRECLPVRLSHCKDIEFTQEQKDVPQLIQLRAELINGIPNDADIKPIDSLYSVRNGTVRTMNPYIVNIFTAIVLDDMFLIELDHIEEFGYMGEMRHVDFDIYSKFKKLAEFRLKYFASVDKENDPIYLEAKKLLDFQVFCRNATPEEIERESEKQFMLSDVTGAVAVDMSYIHLFQELKDYNAGVGKLLSFINTNVFETNDGIKEVQKYLSVCGRDNWSWTPD